MTTIPEPTTTKDTAEGRRLIEAIWNIGEPVEGKQEQVVLTAGHDGDRKMYYARLRVQTYDIEDRVFSFLLFDERSMPILNERGVKRYSAKNLRAFFQSALTLVRDPESNIDRQKVAAIFNQEVKT